MSSKINLTCLNFQLREGARANICALAEALFRQELFISNVNMTLEATYNRGSKYIYEVTLFLTLRNSEVVAFAQEDDLTVAVATAIKEAQGLLRDRLHFFRQESAPV